MTATSGPPEGLRAPDRRPRAVLVDVFETMAAERLDEVVERLVALPA